MCVIQCSMSLFMQDKNKQKTLPLLNQKLLPGGPFPHAVHDIPMAGIWQVKQVGLLTFFSDEAILLDLFPQIIGSQYVR